MERSGWPFERRGPCGDSLSIGSESRAVIPLCPVIQCGGGACQKAQSVVTEGLAATFLRDLYSQHLRRWARR